MEAVRAYVCLGSNMDKAEENLKHAVEKISIYPYAQLAKMSSVYVTEPQEDKNQNWFHNQMIGIDIFFDKTKEELTQDFLVLEALKFLDFLLQIEKELGRVRDESRRFGPRIIDLDLIFFGDLVMKEEKLTLPHPRFQSRAFVLIPLQEMSDEGMLFAGKPIEQLLEAINYTVDGKVLYQD